MMPSPDIKVTIRFEVVSPAGKPVDAVDEVHALDHALTDHGFAVDVFGPYSNDDGTVSDGFTVEVDPMLPWKMDARHGHFGGYVPKAKRC